MPLALTERQQILFNRLVTLGRWASEGKLPAEVLEIRGFGSFFRGKPKPRDVDLLVRHVRSTKRPEFERFLMLVRRIRRDHSYQRRFSTPREAMLHVIDTEQAEGVPRVAENGNERDRFLEWIEAYSWNMLHPRTMQQQYDVEHAEEYAKRMVRWHLPKLTIVEFLNPDKITPLPVGLRCGFTVSIWSKENPDTQKNLEELLSEERTLEHTVRELAYFGMQLTTLRAQVELLRATIGELLRTPRRECAEPDWKWYDVWFAQQETLREPFRAFEQAADEALAFDEKIRGSERLPKAYERLPRQRLIRLADSKRKEIKDHYDLIDALDEVRYHLAEYKSGEASTHLPPREYVIWKMLSKGSARQRKKKTEILQELLTAHGQL